MTGPLFKSISRAALALSILLALSSGASADSLLPLATETAATLPKGTAEAILGASYFQDLRFPPFTPPGEVREFSGLGPAGSGA